MCETRLLKTAIVKRGDESGYQIVSINTHNFSLEIFHLLLIYKKYRTILTENVKRTTG